MHKLHLIITNANHLNQEGSLLNIGIVLMKTTPSNWFGGGADLMTVNMSKATLGYYAMGAV